MHHREPDIFIPQHRRPEWDHMVSNWTGDYRAESYAFQDAVTKLAEADWTAQLRKRELARFEESMYLIHGDLPSVEWSAEEQKKLAVLTTRFRDAHRHFMQLRTATERSRKTRDDAATASRKPNAPVEPAKVEYPDEIAFIEQHGYVTTSENGKMEIHWTPSNADVLRALQTVSPEKFPAVLRVLELPDPLPEELSWARNAGRYVTRQINRDDFPALAENERVPEPEPQPGSDDDLDLTPMPSGPQPWTTETVLL